MPSFFITQLNAYCLEGNFGDPEKLEKLASQYGELCAAVNEKCAQLRKFVESRMVEEARAWYAQQVPPLQEQVADLTFPGRSRLIDALKVYGLPLPEEIDSAVLFEYSEMLKQGANLAPLLDEFRRVARSGDPESALAVARRILAVSPDSKEWGQTVEKLEQAWQTQLVKQARDFIVKEDYSGLAGVAEKLFGTQWKTPVRPEILKKIRETLVQHRGEGAGAVGQQAAQQTVEAKPAPAGSILEELRAYCAAGDFTDAGRLGALGEAYGDLCASVNAKCTQLREFVKKGMREEARAWYVQQYPPLQEQVAELTFPGKDAFVDALMLNDLPAPVKVDAEALFAYSELLKEGAGLTPLLDAFRRLAKSNDTGRKLAVARQILAAAPEKEEWRQTVQKLDADWQAELVEGAKACILKEDYAKLAGIEKALKETEWQSPVRPEILKKISDTLHDHELKMVGERVAALMRKCDDLYRNDFEGNLEGMVALLEQTDEIRREHPDLVMDAETAEIYGQLGEVVGRRREELAREAEMAQRHESACANLNGLIEGNGSAMDLQQAWRQVELTGGAIPEELKYRYETAFRTRAATESRRRIVRRLVTIVCVVFFIALLVLGLQIYSRIRLVNAYDARLEQILEDRTRPVSDADGVFLEIEKEHPLLLKDRRLARHRARLEERRLEQGERADRYQALEAKMLEELADFKANAVSLRETLQEMRTLATVPPLSEKFEQMQERFENLEKKYLKGQDEAYRATLRQLRDTYRKFSVALTEDRALAESLIGSMKEQVKALETIADVAPEVKSSREATDTIARVAKAETEFEQSGRDGDCLALITKFEALARPFIQAYEHLSPVSTSLKDDYFPLQSKEFLAAVRQLPEEMRIDRLPAFLVRLGELANEVAACKDVGPAVRERVQEVASTMSRCEELGGQAARLYDWMQESYIDILNVRWLDRSYSTCVANVKRFCEGLPPCPEIENLLRFQEEQLGKLHEIQTKTGTIDLMALGNETKYGAMYAQLLELFRKTVSDYEKGHPRYAMLVLDEKEGNRRELFFQTTEGAILKTGYPFRLDGQIRKDGVLVEKLPVVGTRDTFSISTAAKLNPMLPDYYPAKLGSREFALFLRLRYETSDTRMHTTLKDLLERNPASHHIWVEDILQQLPEKLDSDTLKEDNILLALRELAGGAMYKHDHWQRALLEQALLHCINDFYAEKFPNLEPRHAFAVTKEAADKLDALIARHGDKKDGDAWAMWSWDDLEGYRAFTRALDEVNLLLDKPEASFVRGQQAFKTDAANGAFVPVALVIKSLKDNEYWTITYYDNYTDFYVWDAKAERMVKAGTRSNGKNTYVDKAGTADHRIFSEPMTLLYGCSATAIPQN